MTDRYTARHKMMVLYLAPENPLWNRLRDLLKSVLPNLIEKKINWRTTSLTTTHIAALAGISGTTIENWRRLGPISDGAPDRVLFAVQTWQTLWTPKTEQQASEFESLLLLEQKFRVAYEEAQYEIYDIATLLSIDDDVCKQVCDSVIYDTRPLLPNVYYAPASILGPDGSRHKQQYAGMYFLWVKRETLWLQAALNVRYLAKLAHDTSFLRCKLNFPVINEGQVRTHVKAGEKGRRVPDYLEYDGFMSVRDHRLYFSFERRDSSRNDYFHFITCRKNLDDKGAFILRGQYLTTGQDAHQSIVGGDILLRRYLHQSVDATPDSSRAFMWHSAKVISPGDNDFGEIEELWNRYENAKDFDEGWKR